jgi:hypothetical protein
MPIKDTHADVEEWSAMIATMQGKSRKGPKIKQHTSQDTEHWVLKGYEKHWIESTSFGWQIRIAIKDKPTLVIDCHFADYYRDKRGRIHSKVASKRSI